MKLTPIIVLVDEPTIRRLQEQAACADMPAGLAGAAERNGWTSEMLVGGVILSAALDPTT